MRTIKFRAQLIYGREWVYGDLIQWNDGKVDILSDVRQEHVIPETVGQFTGLFDKDGAEIYEGDKVHSKISSYSGTEKYHIVEWFDCKYVAKGFNGSMEVKPILNFRTDWKVIGNIHDKTSNQ